MERKTLTVLDMSCVVCAGNVERAVKSLDGVEEATVNFAANSITISYNPKKITLQQIKTAVQNAGYDLVIDNADADRQKAEQRQYGSLRRRLVVAWLLAIPVAVISMTALHEFAAARWAMAVLSTVILGYSGKNFYVKAWSMAKEKSANMDTLVALSTATAWIFSMLLLLFPGFAEAHGMGHFLYFDSATMIVAFVLTGRMLEERAKNSTTSAIRSLMNLQPPTVILLNEDGAETEIPVSQVRPGDRIAIKPGQRVPIDGEVADGETYVDESMLTGEPMPIVKSKGSKVFAGTINGKGMITAIATKPSTDTVLARIVAMVRDAQGSKAPVQRIADVISKYFTFVVIAISAITLIAWLSIGGMSVLPSAIVCAVSVLVIACPCALGLATPTALTVGIGKAAQRHILIKDAAALEKMCKVDAVVLDKTGTITEGKPVITSIKRSPKASDADLCILLAAEEKSEHPVAAEIVSQLRQQGFVPGEISGFLSVTGKGVSMTANGRIYWAGNRHLALDNGVEVPDGDRGGTTIYFGTKDRPLLATITMADQIKATTPEAIRKLNKLGLQSYMLTGDNESSAASVAKDIGVTAYQSSMLPDDKDKFIQSLQAQGKTVAMIGDGINDSQALARADVSIAMGNGTDIAMETAMVTFTTSDLQLLPTAIRLSKATMRIVKQNLFWAFVYNTIGIPVAAGVLYAPMGITLDPMWASAAMALSSVSVVLNSLRLKTLKL